MYKKYGDKAEFFVVYIREAHPTDGRQSRENEVEKILVRQPKTIEERSDVAFPSLPTYVRHGARKELE